MSVKHDKNRKDFFMIKKKINMMRPSKVKTCHVTLVPPLTSARKEL